jgi:hypothetical protein
MLCLHIARDSHITLSSQFKPNRTFKDNMGVLTDGLEALSRQCQEPEELPEEHPLGGQPRIDQGDANLHELQT